MKHAQNVVSEGFAATCSSFQCGSRARPWGSDGSSGRLLVVSHHPPPWRHAGLWPRPLTWRPGTQAASSARRTHSSAASGGFVVTPGGPESAVFASGTFTLPCAARPRRGNAASKSHLSTVLLGGPWSQVSFPHHTGRLGLRILPFFPYVFYYVIYVYVSYMCVYIYVHIYV